MAHNVHLPHSYNALRTLTEHDCRPYQICCI